MLLRRALYNKGRHTMMRKQKSGHIFQVSSVGGRIAVAGNTPYHAAKWAVGGLSDSLAMEVASFGVKICTLEPGGIRTNWARRARQNPPCSYRVG
jgi:NAD(P)-dependent dehydrogenase (short-subunit alcohol dehydrogenase family)